MTRHAQLTPQEFVDKWRRSKLKESAGSQSHFNDLCRMLDHPTPAKADPEGTTFTFEKGADKSSGGQGWADVWKKGFFAWEYKGLVACKLITRASLDRKDSVERAGRT